MVRTMMHSVLDRRRISLGYPTRGFQQFPSANTAPRPQSHTPSCVHFLWTQGLMAALLPSFNKKTENQYFSASIMKPVGYAASLMWHEICELETIQDELFFDAAQTLFVKAQSRQLKQPKSMYKKLRGT